MKLNQFTDYGLRVLMYLAHKPDEPAATISELSDTFAISRNHLVKVVQFLSNHKILRARRGKGGGLSLSAPPESFKVGQLVALLEQSDCVIDCGQRDCALQGNCLLKYALSNAYKEFIRFLDNYTLKDVAGGRTESILRELMAKE